MGPQGLSREVLMDPQGLSKGVPIRPEASRAIKRKAKMGYVYKAFRPKVTWTVKV